MVYFIVSKQILYVLHTQLASLPEARKRAYGIGSVSYSIAGDFALLPLLAPRQACKR